MIGKIKEILNAWSVSLNPTEEQKELAEKRYEICLGCEFYGKERAVTKDEYCKKCLCPIKKKIFTQEINDTCPLNKWESVEKEFRESKLKNNKYRII